MMKLTKLVLAGMLVSSTAFAPVKAADNIFMSVVGVVLGTPVGMFGGGIRGAASKGIEYADVVSEDLGDGPLGNIFGIPVGLIVGEVAGGLTGVLKGAITGVKVGYSDPLTNESFSVDGPFLDYDPYDFDNI